MEFTDVCPIAISCYINVNMIVSLIYRKNYLLIAGVVPDTRHDDRTEFPGRPDHHDDKSSIRQFLESSYRKNINPSLKDEIHRSFENQVHSRGESASKSMQKTNYLYNIN